MNTGPARTFTRAELRTYARRAAANRRQIRADRRGDDLTRRLLEQIRYGVALTNQCRHCQVAHETFALHAGASPAELAAVVGGDPSVFEPAAWTAILYAQALAANDFADQPALRAEAQHYWSPRQCELIEAAALQMTVSNRCGNTWDALLRRTRGEPDHDSRLVDEIAVSAVFLAGAVLSALKLSAIRREAPWHLLAAIFREPEPLR